MRSTALSQRHSFIVIGNFLSLPIRAGQAYQGLSYTPKTNTLGANSMTLSFNPTDVNDSGYSASLPTINLIVKDTIAAPAQAALNTPSTMIFPNVRVGTAESRPVSVTNTATASAQSLDVTLSVNGQATASGSVTLLAPGATDATDLTVGLDTSVVGARSGAVTLNFESDGGNGSTSPILPNPNVDVFGSVYRPAAAGAIAPVSEIVHVGAPGSAILAVRNTDPADGFSEHLIAALSVTTGNIDIGAAGPTSEIAPGASDSNTLRVGFSTAQAGTDSGTATVALSSDGGTGPNSIDGLSQLALTPQNVAVNVTVNNFAVAALAETSGAGTFSHNAPNSQGGNDYTLALGSLAQGSTPVTVHLAALNAALAPADDLSGTFQVGGNGSGAFTNSLSGFNDLTAGGSDPVGTVTFNTGTAGNFSETITLAATGSNASGYSAAAPEATLTIEGTIAPAAPVLTGQVKVNAATEGKALPSGTTVATFTDSNTADVAGSFAATINWGDGATTTGIVTGSNGSFTVSGGHTYGDEGSDTLSMTITRTAGGTELPLQGTITVAEGDALTPLGTTIAATANTPFSGTVATFSDSYTGSGPGDFAATINWGDGAATTSGVVSGGNGTFTVSGGHTYTATGTDTITVTLSDDAPGTANATAKSAANVSGTFTPDLGALSIGYWYNHHNTKGVIWDEATLTGYGKGILLGDYTGTAWEGGGTAANPKALSSVPAGMMFIPDGAAGQLINASQSARDVRQTLLSQAIAAQLNIDNQGVPDPGYYPGTAPNGHDLIGEAVKWLTGRLPFQYADSSTGNVDTNQDGILETGIGGSAEYNTLIAALTSAAERTSTGEWNTYVDPINSPPKTGDITVNGQDLKNALQAFNVDQLVTAMNSFQVGWYSNGAASDIQPNTPDTFWNVLKDQHVIAGPMHA
jgi:hypothetical protein